MPCAETIHRHFEGAAIALGLLPPEDPPSSNYTTKPNRMEMQKVSNDQMTSCKRIVFFVSCVMIRRVMNCVEYCGVKTIIYLAVFWFKPIKYAFKKSDYFEWIQSHETVTHLGRNKLAKISVSSASIDLHAKVNSIIYKNSLNLHKSLADGTALPNLNKLVMFQSQYKSHPALMRVGR